MNAFLTKPVLAQFHEVIAQMVDPAVQRAGEPDASVASPDPTRRRMKR